MCRWSLIRPSAHCWSGSRLCRASSPCKRRRSGSLPEKTLLSGGDGVPPDDRLANIDAECRNGPVSEIMTNKREGGRSVPDNEASPFHQGETAMQERLGDRDVERWVRGAVRRFMPQQHRSFFAAQPFLIASARDADGRPWATLLEGGEGFVASPDAAGLEIKALPVTGDALDGALSQGADVGILGIELSTRRRNRVNGTVKSSGDGGFSFSVGQSFGNCPQYIRERSLWHAEDQPVPTVTRAGVLSERQKAWITSVDTFFIASGYRGEGESEAYGMDVSHRGGDRGFIEVGDASHLRFPDYAGNRFYNTLGNILIDPRAGLLFIDFATGSLLQLTGRATIDFDPGDAPQFAGARQIVAFQIEEVVELRSAIRLRWQADGDAVRSLRLVEKVEESEDVVSFTFEARDSGALAPFSAGQHLPIEVLIPDLPVKISRSYSLSGSPAWGRYRISLKRHPGGMMSNHFHDVLEVGDMIEARSPSGGFDLGEVETPLVLVSAGIGVTPMLSTLHQVAAECGARPVWFVHAARDALHHPFRAEIRTLQAACPNITTLTYYSRPAAGDRAGIDYDVEGRLSGDDLSRLTSDPSARFLLCGPADFTAKIEADLVFNGVDADRIGMEAF
ncbi:ferredoxin [Rhodobacterales bacterium]|nr:ferredoxin [Rhodobacterales bacterium]